MSKNDLLPHRNHLSGISKLLLDPGRLQIRVNVAEDDFRPQNRDMCVCWSEKK
jgi:hypothetical protein